MYQKITQYWHIFPEECRHTHAHKQTTSSEALNVTPTYTGLLLRLLLLEVCRRLFLEDGRHWFDNVLHRLSWTHTTPTRYSTPWIFISHHEHSSTHAATTHLTPTHATAHHEYLSVIMNIHRHTHLGLIPPSHAAARQEYSSTHAATTHLTPTHATAYHKYASVIMHIHKHIQRDSSCRHTLHTTAWILVSHHTQQSSLVLLMLLYSIPCYAAVFIHLAHNIKTWTGLPMEESIRMTEERDRRRKYVHSVANSQIEDGLRKKQNSSPTPTNSTKGTESAVTSATCTATQRKRRKKVNWKWQHITTQDKTMHRWLHDTDRQNKMTVTSSCNKTRRWHVKNHCHPHTNHNQLKALSLLRSQLRAVNSQFIQLSCSSTAGMSPSCQSVL